jgi:hypothetical protein
MSRYSLPPRGPCRIAGSSTTSFRGLTIAAAKVRAWSKTIATSPPDSGTVTVTGIITPIGGRPVTRAQPAGIVSPLGETTGVFRRMKALSAGAVRLGRPLWLEAGAGRYPPDVTGFLHGSFAQLGLRFGLGRGTRAAPEPVRVTRADGRFFVPPGVPSVPDDFGGSVGLLVVRE